MALPPERFVFCEAESSGHAHQMVVIQICIGTVQDGVLDLVEGW